MQNTPPFRIQRRITVIGDSIAAGYGLPPGIRLARAAHRPPLASHLGLEAPAAHAQMAPTLD